MKPKEQRATALDRVAELTAYQNAAYARRYSNFVDEVAGKSPALAEVVARNLYKLMAYKDEYEVARLLTKPSFENQVKETWSQVESISYNLHPPLLRNFGFHKKIAFGAWFRTPLQMLAAMKSLRGGPLDIFGRSKHRKLEHSLIAWYRRLILQTLERLSEETLPDALEIAALPDQIRGYERIKEATVAQTKKRATELLARMQPESTLVG